MHPNIYYYLHSWCFHLNDQTLPLLIIQCDILRHQTETTYRDPKTYDYGTVEDDIQILESPYGNLTKKAGIRQKNWRPKVTEIDYNTVAPFYY